MLNNQNTNTDNLFIIKATNDLMTNESHPKSISIGDSVIFDYDVKPYSGCVALIETKTNYHSIVMLKECDGGFVGVYLKEDYQGVEVPIRSVVAVATGKTTIREFD